MYQNEKNKIIMSKKQLTIKGTSILEKYIDILEILKYTN